MQLPARLLALLARDAQLEAAVKLSVSQFEPWIRHSDLPFFPEYTKHDIDHIEAVLRTATSLIRDEAWDSMTSADAAVLVIAVLLHDCAMHITEDGFISLLSETRPHHNTPGMDDRSWTHLWEDFLAEASRFDGRRLVNLFGNLEPAARPPLDPNKMTRRDRLLIGEFIRRHHARLAQEIALFGVPTSGPTKLVLEGFIGQHSQLSALSGLIARSHGDDVRKFLPTLKDQYDLREYRGVHAVFLMVLLRVADYLQVDSERAPLQSLQVRQLASPVSVGEWRAHQAIRDVRHTHEDPESVFIDAMPDDVRTFMKIRSWLDGIQKELDTSWAVLGEVYGRFRSLQSLGLVLRRVRSSLDDLAGFEHKVDYLPRLARFQAADADLLKLLIEPLYGDDPGIGVRELVQNAIDAVREVREYPSDVRVDGDTDAGSEGADAVVSIAENEDGTNWLVVRDRGIGMTADIVINYFLTAGASFRRSEDWRKTFEDSDGKSRILRAGRFGVGALAAFLLGSEIEVSTRHIDDSVGIEFVASVESDVVELRRCERAVGTTVKVRLSNELTKRFKQPVRYLEGVDWDWYCLGDPSLERVVNGTKKAQAYTLPTAGATPLPQGWRRIRHDNYEDVLWTYNKNVPGLTCNGIKIGNRVTQWEKEMAMAIPSVSVFDADGKLPLDFQRDKLTTRTYPFDDALANDVATECVAFALSAGSTGTERPVNCWSWLSSMAYEGSTRARVKDQTDWYFSDDGYGYLDSGLVARTRCASILVVRGFPDMVLPTPAKGQVMIVVRHDGSVLSRDGWVRGLVEVGCNGGLRPQAYIERTTPIAFLKSLECRGARVLGSESAILRARDGRVPQSVMRRATTEALEGGVDSLDDWRV